MTPLALESRIFASASEALLDEPVGTGEAGDFLRDVGARAPMHVAWGIRAVLWLALFAPFLLAGKMRTLLSLPAAERAALWVRALDHRSYAVRQLAILLKAFACLVRYDVPRPRAGGVS